MIKNTSLILNYQINYNSLSSYILVEGAITCKRQAFPYKFLIYCIVMKAGDQQFNYFKIRSFLVVINI